MDMGIATLREECGEPELGPGTEETIEARMPEADVDAVVCIDRSGKVALDPVGMAEYLRDVGYRYVDGRMFRFDGRFLVPASRQDMMDALVDATRLAGHRVMITNTARENVISYWSSISNPERMSGIGAGDGYDGWLIPFENGLYSVGRRRLMPFTPDILFEGCIHTPYSPERADAADARIRPVYERIFGDSETLDFFLLAAGYTLYSERLTPPAIFVLIGRGGTGKSAVLNALEALLGSDRVANMSPAKLSTQFGLSRLKGMAANLCDEAGVRRRDVTVDGDLIKAISGGRPWDVEAKFRDIEKFSNKAKLWFASNAMPDLGDTSSGMMRRVFIFPCDTYQKPSSRIYDIMTSADGKAWLAINALRAFIEFKWSGEEEFHPPEAMESRKSEFCIQDTVLSWVMDTCGTLEDREVVRDYLDRMDTTSAYDDYRMKTMEDGRTPIVRNTFVSRICTEYGMRASRRTIRGPKGNTSRAILVKASPGSLAKTPDDVRRARVEKDIKGAEDEE